MRLRVVTGKSVGATIDVGDELVLGRTADPPGDVGSGATLSRRHARIARGVAGHVIEDLGSANGTFVNGELVEGMRTLVVGDRIEVGDAVLEVESVASPVAARQTVVIQRPLLAPAAATQAPAAAAPAPTRRSVPTPVVALLGVLALGLAVVAVLGLLDDDDDSADGTPAAAPAEAEAAAGWVYVLSNDPEDDRNSVLAIDYREDGSFEPARIREFPTRGTGVPLIPGRSLGTVAGDAQVSISPDRRFLFAVNQGSDTVAVFRIDAATGALEHVPGSPFASGGRAPVSVGFNGEQLIVVNKGIVPGEELPGDPGRTNYALFTVDDDGSLTPGNVLGAPGSGPTAAMFSPDGRVVFGAEFFAFQFGAFTIGDDGDLRRAPGSPTQFPDSVIEGAEGPPGGGPPDQLRLAYGVVVHPTEPFVYYIAAVANRVVTYRYDDSGRLEFVSQADNPDTIAACWARITRDGRFLYTGNSSLSVSVYRVVDGGAGLERIELQQGQTGSTIGNVELDAQDRFLFALGTSDSPDNPLGERASPANSVEAYRIQEDGTLQENGALTLPVPRDMLPYGLAVLEREG